jgi:hypothetical protein
MRAVLTNEKTLSVSPVGSALEADKKINLGIKISVNVEVAEASRAASQRRSVNGRSDGLYPASGLSLARSAGHLWTLELCLYTLAPLVSGRTVGQTITGVGGEGSRPIALFGCQPYQGTSGCEQPCWRPTKSGHWADQGWFEHQAQRMGGRARTSDQFESGGWTSRRGNRGTSFPATGIARNGHGCRQSLRQRRLSGTVAAMGKPALYPASVQPPSASQLASRLLSQTTQGRELIPTLETQPSHRHAL